MKKYLISTSANHLHAEFLVNHWLISLLDTCNLKHIDIAVIDYGLTNDQVKELKKKNVIVIKKTKTKQVVVNKFIDLADFLKRHYYDQVLLVDGRDIIFQKDISHLFTKDTDYFRGVALDMEILFNEVFILKGFHKKIALHMYRFLKDKAVINAALIIAPSQFFGKISEDLQKYVKETFVYGPDQIVMNYVFYQHKYVLLERTNNFLLGTSSETFSIRNGVFYDSKNNHIHVVHNAGHKNMLRPIINFGYGKSYNQINLFGMYVKKIFYSLLKFIKPFAQLYTEFRLKLY